MDIVGARLTEERVRLGMSQAEIAALAGVGRTTQIRYESGASSPDAAYLLALAAHGLDMLYVLTGQRGVDTVGLLSAEEFALVDNYRAASPEHQASLRAVGASFAEQDKRKEDITKANAVVLSLCPISERFGLIRRGKTWIPEDRTANWLMNGYGHCRAPR